MAKTFSAGQDGHLAEHNKWAGFIEDAENGDIPALVGPPGPPGPDGKSAYEVWLEQGNVGTEADFLESIKGEPGDPGPPGEDGQDGADGDTPTALHTTYVDSSISAGQTKFEFVEGSWSPD